MSPRRDVDRTAARARALGADVHPGKLTSPFPCVLPGHESHPARLAWIRGFWHYRCGHDKRSYELSEVRAYQGYGEPPRISELERIRWRELLDYEAGISDRGPAPIPLPPDCSEPARRVGEAWRLLVGLRDPEVWPIDEPFVFARRFVMARASVSFHQARRAVEELEDFGSMYRVADPVRPEDPVLWRPGPSYLLIYGTPAAAEDALVDDMKAAFDAVEVERR